MLSKPKSRKVAALIAFIGTVLPISGFHKFYLGQPRWGILYLMLCWTPIPRVASAIEAVWYLLQDQEQFDRNFNFALTPTEASSPSQRVEIDPAQVGAVADALRQLDSLRQEGLMSEYEFEQKRRQLLDRIA
ncbi:MAG: NINE protein [Coleofasciculaceae cyanobacterium]